MKTILTGLALTITLFLVSACSKAKPEAETAASSVTVTTSVGTFSLADVDKAIKEKDYENAVKILGQFKAREMSLEAGPRSAYEQKLHETVNALLEVKYQDPKAAAAYDLLSKIISGR